jgi:hypothetical protein
MVPLPMMADLCPFAVTKVPQELVPMVMLDHCPTLDLLLILRQKVSKNSKLPTSNGLRNKLKMQSDKLNLKDNKKLIVK